MCEVALVNVTLEEAEIHDATFLLINQINALDILNITSRDNLFQSSYYL